MGIFDNCETVDLKAGSITKYKKKPAGGDITPLMQTFHANPKVKLYS